MTKLKVLKWWPTRNSSQCSSWKFLSVTNQIFFSLINKIFISVTKLKVLHSGNLKKIPLSYNLKVPPKNQGENVSQLPPQNSLQRSGWIFLLTKLNIPVSDQIENSSWWQAQNSSQRPCWKFLSVTIKKNSPQIPLNLSSKIDLKKFPSYS